MDRILYTAGGGAARMLEQQAVISHNLANVNTTGFRQQLAVQRAVPFVADQGVPTRVATVASTPGSDFTDGPLAETGNPLHVALQGPGWFAIQTHQGEAYTRGGEFAVNADNLLVTRQGGFPVLSADGGIIEIPDRGTVTITTDGQLSALGAGDQPNTVQAIGQLRLVNPPADQMLRGDDGLFRTAPGAAAPVDPTVRVASGFLEKSNVSAAQTMVALIENARQFELQMKVIRDASGNAERANSILSSGG